MDYKELIENLKKVTAGLREDDCEKGIFRYLHFTKTGSKWHEVSIDEAERRWR